MKITCSKEEAKILIRNCKYEQCDFCFLKEVCHGEERSSNISRLLEIKENE